MFCRSESDPVSLCGHRVIFCLRKGKRKMLGKVEKNVGLAPWEQEYEEQKQREEQRTGTLLTRSQWRAQGRTVIVGDEEARRSVVARSNGHTLRLFAEDQTRERTAWELERDGCIREAA
jgi:hypothetical protein